MPLQLSPLSPADLSQFKADMQEAFQRGAVDGGFPCQEVPGEIILPEEDIDRSLNTPGAIAYKAVENGALIGGAVVVIDKATQHNHLDFLYVKFGTQSRGVGQFIWTEIERLHPETKIWETCTPYFEKRNIHFYVNRCGFHIVTFYNKHYPDPSFPSDEPDFDGMFVFEKVTRADDG